MWQFLQKRWVYHSLIWIAGFVTVEAIAWVVTPAGSFSKRIGESAVYTLPFIPIVYFNFFLKARLYDQRKYWQYFLSIPIQVLLGVALYRLDYLLFEDAKQSALQDMSNVFFLMAFTTGLQYFKRGIVGQYQLQELRAKTAQIELNSLKAQINPHFLFNTLNNIYATNQLNQDKGSEMIMELSEVMRYHLHFSKLDKVPLEDEIQLAKSYIELEKLRVSDTCEIRVDTQSVDASLPIAPLMLLPFLENAFKHGTHPTKPCFVALKIHSEAKRVIFEISNSIIPNKRIVRTEIGLANTQRRLELIYPKQHQLEITEDAAVYTVRLSIDT